MVKRFIFIALLLSPLAMIPAFLYLVRLPDTKELLTVNPTTSAFREYREEQVRKKGKKPASSMVWRDLGEISLDLQRAVVLSEDDTFFKHQGFDIEQFKRAIRINWERKSYAFGASTLTQQLARTLYLSPSKNLLRKAKEALITRRLEKTLPKERILELYLNVVEWGPHVYGAEAASWHFFQKSAAELTTDEALSLAVILPSPRRLNPLSQVGYIAGRKVVLYNRMVRAIYIAPEEPVEPEETLDPEERIEEGVPAVGEELDQPAEEEPDTIIERTERYMSD